MSKYSELIKQLDNLKWLGKQDLPSKIWKMIITKVDELNIMIVKFKIMTLEIEVKENLVND